MYQSTRVSIKKKISWSRIRQYYAHLAEAAKYVKQAWDDILPISIENCFRKADILIQYPHQLEPCQEIVEADQISSLIDGVSKLNVDDLLEFFQADDKDSE